MSVINSFHEVRFPADLALGATGGPERRTEIVTLGSGREQRNTRWAHSRRRFNAGYGVKTVDDLHAVIAFFEERRGRLFGFRFRDPFDWKSCPPGQIVTPTDQSIGTGDGQEAVFRITKRYGSDETGYLRNISKPVDGTVIVAVDGLPVPSSDYSVDETTGTITFQPASIPPDSASITCGFEFDIPVRFDTDEIAMNMGNFEAGDIPSIPLVELLS
ncbi:MAG: DUF2460 domain-containing protein [Rhizobiaceae bacterium]|nr:DUF2460 domain-containing protein [Rhizobiaceae bacterium]